MWKYHKYNEFPIQDILKRYRVGSKRKQYGRGGKII